jgi:LPS O-antigen subunit length determinant protein (WzzB/FepE family)
MNAKEARRLSIKSKPEADQERKRAIIAWAIRTVEELKRKKAERKAAFDKRYVLVQESIEAACKRGETKCDHRTQYEDKDFTVEILKTLGTDGFKAELAKRGYMDEGSNSEGYPDGNKFWHEFEVIAIEW